MLNVWHVYLHLVNFYGFHVGFNIPYIEHLGIAWGVATTLKQWVRKLFQFSMKGTQSSPTRFPRGFPVLRQGPKRFES